MRVNYFFRKSTEVFHSIEEQFLGMQKHLPKDVKCRNVFACCQSKGIFRRIFIVLQSAFVSGDVNHITGDIHFAAMLMRKRKTILTVHDIGSVLNKTGTAKKIMRFVWFVMPFARVSCVTVISDFTKKEILKNFKISSSKIHIIPDCVSDLFQHSPKTFNAAKPRILMVGTKSNKNLERQINALAHINCKLIIIGKLSETQVQLLKNNSVQYENYVNLPYEEVAEHYRKADIVSFVTLYEGFGVPVLEAQATGRVLLTSNRSPMKENAGKGALLADAENTDDIREKMLRLINDSELRESLVEEGLENVKRFRPQFVAKQYYQLYKKIIY